MTMYRERRFSLVKDEGNLSEAIRTVMSDCGILKHIAKNARIAIKPNFTYPYFKPGVTTNPGFLKKIVELLKLYTDHIAIVETDGGYGAWKAAEAFAGHGMDKLKKNYGVEIVNLCDEKSEEISFRSRGKTYHVPLPIRLLRETDIFISVPVPKIHCMTRLSLGYKNQWGCIPDIMRLRRHYIFNDTVIAINRALKPCVVADGTYFLDHNGPMEGIPVKMDLVMAATDCGSFDRVVSEIMGIPWKKIGYMRKAVAVGDMPSRLDDISRRGFPGKSTIRVFHLKRTFRNRIALVGFKSRWITWFGYESWFGRVIIHGILYAICGKPVKPKEND